MTEESKILGMVREAGMTIGFDGDWIKVFHEHEILLLPVTPAVMKLADLIRADERGKIMELCDLEYKEFISKAAENNGRESDFAFGSVSTAERLKEAIRAMGATPSREGEA